MTRPWDRAESAEWQWLYKTRAWLIGREVHLAEHPWCRYCALEGKPEVPATVVDHVKPHKGDQALFFDPTNWQSLCQTHHDSAKASEEARGYHALADEDGWPVDPRHPANSVERRRGTSHGGGKS